MKLALLAILATLSIARADDDPCAKTTCRPPTKVSVRTKTNEVFEVAMPALPYVLGTMSRVLPGDDFYITGDIKGDTLANLRHVAAPNKPADVIHIRFSQPADPKAKPTMVLAITSYFKRPVVYDAKTQLAGDDNFHDTKVVQLSFDKTSYESWPGGMTSILLQDFRFAPAAK